MQRASGGRAAWRLVRRSALVFWKSPPSTHNRSIPAISARWLIRPRPRHRPRRHHVRPDVRFVGCRNLRLLNHPRQRLLPSLHRNRSRIHRYVAVRTCSDQELIPVPHLRGGSSLRLGCLQQLIIHGGNAPGATTRHRDDHYQGDRSLKSDAAHRQAIQKSISKTVCTLKSGSSLPPVARNSAVVVIAQLWPR